MNELKTTGKLTFDADGDQVELLEEDLLIDAAQMPGYVSDTEYETTVVLDTNLTPELVEEGFVREIISKIQTMRKEAGFEVMDHIRVYFAQNDKIKLWLTATMPKSKMKYWQMKSALIQSRGIIKSGISTAKPL